MYVKVGGTSVMPTQMDTGYGLHFGRGQKTKQKVLMKLSCLCHVPVQARRATVGRLDKTSNGKMSTANDRRNIFDRHDTWSKRQKVKQ